VYLEEARKIKAVALDKTGTITEGKPAGGLRAVDAGLGSKSWRGWPEPAARSDHPVSKAIADGVSPPRKRWTNFRPLPGAACRA
jgi:Cd2+/Zn2+-exporting ATPase